MMILYLLASKTTSKFKDIPNERSLHSTPVPRIGGVALMLGIFIGWGLMYESIVWWVVAPLLLLFFTSLLDDIYNLPVKLRLLLHVIAAAFFVYGSELHEQQGFVVAAVTLLFVVWMTNLYNFMDGSDGLAGGMAFFGFGMYAIAAYLSQNTALASLNICVAAASAGFLLFNFYPAKIFMGDSGSISLGFLAAVMGLWGWQQGTWAVWFPLFVFSPFIVDASVTLVKRALRGAKVTEAHREHYYQRLIQMGWGHRNVALAEYGLMLSVGGSALSVKDDSWPWQLLLLWVFIYICAMLQLDIRWKIYKQGQNV